MTMFIIYLLCICNITKVLSIPVRSNELINTENISQPYPKKENTEDNELTDERIKKENIPEYMEKLYKKMSKQKDLDNNLMYSGNVVRSYFDKETYQIEENLHRYEFDISNIQKEKEIVTNAELHLYKQPDKKYEQSTQSLLQINVQDIDSGQIISSRILSSKAYGWQVFRVTDIVKKWIEDKKTNKGLYITVQPLYGQNKNLKFETKKSVRKEPLLVVYTKDDNDLLLASLFNLNATDIFNNNADNEREITDYKPIVNRVRRKAPSFRPCRVEKLIVPLRKIGWEKSFVSPDSFEINQCKGKCWHDASKAYNKQTNHAMVQALYATVTEGRKASYPCCAPTKFRTVTALMKDGDYSMNIVKLEKLSVTSCECL